VGPFGERGGYYGVVGESCGGRGINGWVLELHILIDGADGASRAE
jgi:hypothetical protein